MNINSTSSSVDNAKVTAVTKAGGQQVQQDESGENSGFLSKLSSLLFGAAPKQTEGQAEAVREAFSPEEASESVTEGQLSAKALSVAEPDETLPGAKQSDDNALPSGAKSEEPDLKSNMLSDEAQVEIPKSLQRFISDDSGEVTDHEQALNNKSQQVMTEGDALLGRLKDASQALAGRNGKTLPLSETDSSQSNQRSPLISAAVQQPGGTQMLSVDSDPMLAATVQEPVAGKSGLSLTPEQMEALNHQANSLTEEQRELLAAQLLAADGQVVAQGEKPSASEITSDAPAVTTSPQTDTVNNGQSGLLTALNPQTTQPSGDGTAVVTEPLPTASGNTGPVSRVQNAAEPEVTTSSVLIQNAADGGDKNKAAVVGNTVQPLMNQLHTVQQTSHPAASVVTPSAAQEPASGGAPLMTAANPAALNPAMNAAMLSQSQIPDPQHALKASLEATGIGKTGQSKAQQAGHDTTLAHQVAAAAGQQGISTATQNLRADQIQPQAQMPLHLSKELDVDDMAQRVQMMMSKNLKQIDIRLDPPELGRLHIRMNMHNEGANVQFTVANHQARDALEHSMPRLREMLAQQGVQLADTSVQQQNSGQQQRYTAGGGGQSGQSSSGEALGGDENLDTDVKLDLNVAAKRDGISYYA